MKRILVVALLCCFVFAAGLWAQAPEKTVAPLAGEKAVDAPPAVKKSVELKNAEEKAAYAFGFSIFQSLSNIPLKLDAAMLVQAMQDAGDSKPKMDEKQKMATIQAFQKYFTEKRQKPETALPADNAPFKSFEERISYCIGLDVATQMDIKALKLNPAIIIQGMNDFATKAPQAMENKEIQEIVMAMQKDLQTKAAETNLKAGEKFLTENKTREGVKTLSSGLQYKVIKEGDGPKPKAEDSVSVNYRGTTIDGKEFDSSYKRNKPAEFPLNGVIKGWTEILQLMNVGSKYQVFIPANLAYGTQSPAASIPPNATLIFEIELLKIVPVQAPPTGKVQ